MAGESYAALVRRASKQYGVPYNLLMAQLQAESDFNPNSRSGAGAQGIAQFMPGTWSGSWNPYRSRSPFDPAAAIPAQALYMRNLLREQNGDVRLALAAYNAGSGAVKKYGGIPPYTETRNYVDRITKWMGNYGDGAAAGGAPALPAEANAPTPEPAPVAGQPDRASFVNSVIGANARLAKIPTLAVPVVAPPAGAAAAVADALPQQPQQGGSARAVGNVAFPTGGKAKLIGTPHSGTHTLGNWQSDNAVDLGVPNGTPIYATEDGVIAKTFLRTLDPSSRFAGYQVTLRGGANGYFYAHMQRITVKAGQRVRKGQLIGYAGSANGVPHLHIGVENGNPLNLFRLG